LNNNKKIVLVFIRHFLPSFKSGGPVRTLSNMVDNLSDKFIFKFVTLDRDYTDLAPFPNVLINKWTTINGDIDIFYMSQDHATFLNIFHIIRNTEHDIIYLNSFFDYIFTLKVILLNKFFNKYKVILAPRGEFSVGALALKSIRKKIFIYITHYLGLFDCVVWHASTEFERSDIMKHYLKSNNENVNIVLAENIKIKVAIDIPNISNSLFSNKIKIKNTLSIIFLSRICPKKNLDFALRILLGVKANVVFNIYGPIEDPSYWKKCSKIIDSLPSNISCNYLGVLTPDQVSEVLAEHDLFFFPTRGENYGHVIAESLLSSTPILISNLTPWIGLETLGIGYDFPLSDEMKFIKKIEDYASMDFIEFSDIRNTVQIYSAKYFSNKKIIQDNINLFDC